MEPFPTRRGPAPTWRASGVWRASMPTQGPPPALSVKTRPTQAHTRGRALDARSFQTLCLALPFLDAYAGLDSDTTGLSRCLRAIPVPLEPGQLAMQSSVISARLARQARRRGRWTSVRVSHAAGASLLPPLDPASVCHAHQDHFPQTGRVPAKTALRARGLQPRHQTALCVRQGDTAPPSWLARMPLASAVHPENFR